MDLANYSNDGSFACMFITSDRVSNVGDAKEECLHRVLEIKGEKEWMAT